MKYFICLVSLLLNLHLVSQDNYHQELINEFVTDYNLPTPSFVFNDNEEANAESIYFYGSTVRTADEVEGFDFITRLTYDVTAPGSNPWDSGTGISNIQPIAEDDVILFTFWAKRNSGASEVQFFAEDGTTFEKEFYLTLNFTPDWNQYFVSIQANKNYPISSMTAGFHLASISQNFDLAGFTAFNFGNIDIDDVPSTFSAGNYEGSDVDAPWRTEASQRIEEIRKADLTVNVEDQDGKPIENAQVKIIMQEHEFKFGSAFVTCRFQGNRCYDQTYVDKIFDLDGNGHGFNAGVTENALKWDGWEEQWIGTPNETVEAIKYLNSNGVRMRGHTLIWPGFDNMPEDIRQNSNNLDYLRSRIQERIEMMINHPELTNIIREWDVLNEITQNRSLEESFQSDPNFTSGREIYIEILEKVREIDPDLDLYINDYVVLSGGGSSSSVVNRYIEYLDEIFNSEEPFDGIGFQAHIGSTPTSILKAKEVFDQFYERYDKPLSITEYDISDLVDPDVQARYLSDFLTLTFSHPSMEAFIMWGFWDGNHWKGNAPMFDIDWNLKPSGQAFIDKVFNEWWTIDSLNTDAEGISKFRGYKGRYKVLVSNGSEMIEQEIDLTEGDQMTVVLTGVSNLHEVEVENFKVIPSLITDGYFKILNEGNNSPFNIDIHTKSGRLVSSKSKLTSGEIIYIDLTPGIYFVKITTSEGIIARKIHISRS